MAVRASRLLSTFAAGSVLTGSLFLGAGAASAAPAAPAPGGGVVPATCGQTVAAYPGQTVKVTPRVGVPFTQTVTPGMDPVAMSISGLLCSVKVNVLVPAGRLVKVVPPVGQLSSRVSEEASKVLPSQAEEGLPLDEATGTEAPSSAAPQAPAAAPMVPMRLVEAPAAAPAPALSPGALAANAPLFAPAFTSALPSSFVGSAAPLPGLRSFDAGSLFGSAFPGLRAGAPAYLGTDPASAVTTASQVQALPVDGLSDGLGIPAVLAVLAVSGVAAFVVRRMVLGRPALAGGAAPSTGADTASASSLPAAPAAAMSTPATEAAPDDASATEVAPVVPAPDAAETTAATPAVTAGEVTEVEGTEPVVDEGPATSAMPAAEATGVISAVPSEAASSDERVLVGTV